MSVYGVTFEKVLEPRVKVVALTRTTPTMTRKPSVATDTKGPDRRISTAPTSTATPATMIAAMSVAAIQPTGTGPTRRRSSTPASQSGRSDRNADLADTGSVRIAEM